MCGIAGFLSPNIQNLSPEIASMMHADIAYRGRDAQGQWQDNQCALLHTRLSILDIGGGDQPMPSNDGRYVICYNGEVFNYIEIQDELKKQGVIFKTESDTEVILNGFIHYGADIVQKLNGMFAFVIWDKREKSLFIARDHLGKKPFYYRYYKGDFYFSSTTKSLCNLTNETFQDQINIAHTNLFRTFGGLYGDMTMFNDIYALKPGHHAVLKPGDKKLLQTRYWHMDFTKSTITKQDALSQYDQILTQATKIRLRSDVPLALTFSGGVDSGTLAVICVNKLGINPNSFTIDYHDEGSESPDKIRSDELAGTLGLNHRYIQYDYMDHIFSDISRSLKHYDQPCNQLPVTYLHYLYKSIKPHATVAICGNGADELFTGYRSDYQKRRNDIALQIINGIRPITQFIPKLPTIFTQSFHNTAKSKMMAKLPQSDIYGDVYEAVIDGFINDLVDANVQNYTDFNTYYSLMWGANDPNFRMPDITGMDNQVEVRSPFLDHTMVEFACALPNHLKVSSPWIKKDTKYLPKQYYEGHVGRELAQTLKHGMGSNIAFDKRLAQMMEVEFNTSYGALDMIGINAAHAKSKFQNYKNEVDKGNDFNIHAAEAFSNFMLAKWALAQ